MSYTNDSNHPLNFVYERLRKRAQRKANAYALRFGRRNVEDAIRKNAYMRGVNETLKVVEAEVLQRARG